MNCQYYIDKFENIPDERWMIKAYISNTDPNVKCALGWCGERYGFISPEARHLRELFLLIDSSPATVNDGYDLEYQQKTPKERVLAALKDIQKLEEVESAVQECVCA